MSPLLFLPQQLQAPTVFTELGNTAVGNALHKKQLALLEDALENTAVLNDTHLQRKG